MWRDEEGGGGGEREKDRWRQHEAEVLIRMTRQLLCEKE